MEHTNTKKKVSGVVICVFAVLLFVAGYSISTNFPMQELKITAQTSAEEFDMVGTTNLYHFKPLFVPWEYFVPNATNGSYTVVIRFMAVEDTSGNLFTSHGRGQYVYQGCNEMKVEQSYINFGKILHVKLTLNASQTELKLEDGTPFDMTRYSLRPVLTVEEN